MKKFKVFILLNLILLLSSCGTVQDAFSNKKKNSSDEFLVEKKLPLVMPPDYDELPSPNINKTQNQSKEDGIKKLITNKEKVNLDKKKDINENFQDSLLKKIKKN